MNIKRDVIKNLRKCPKSLSNKPQRSTIQNPTQTQVITCYKHPQIRGKANKWPTKKEIMQLKDEKLKKSMCSLLINSDLKDALCEIQTSKSSISNSSKEEITICPNDCNVSYKHQSQEELLLEIIEKIKKLALKINIYKKLLGLQNLLGVTLFQH